MAVPKRKVSKARRDKRRSSVWKLTTPTPVSYTHLDVYKRQVQFDKYPEKEVLGFDAVQGWEAVRAQLKKAAGTHGVLTAEFYPGVHREELVAELSKLGFPMFDAERCAISDDAYQQLIAPFVTQDRVFGVMNTLRLEDVYSAEKLAALGQELAACGGPAVVYGTGASLAAPQGTLIYFDMPRWEIQCRFRDGLKNWKTDNAREEKLRKFKRGFFVEWRMADRKKKELLEKIAYAVDTVVPGVPKMVSGAGLRAGLAKLSLSLIHI